MYILGVVGGTEGPENQMATLPVALGTCASPMSQFSSFLINKMGRLN